MATLREIPDEINPLARIRSVGSSALSNAELLAILIGPTRGEKSPLDVALTTILEWGSLHSLGRMSVEQLMFQYGFTENVATRLIVAAELGKRVSTEHKPLPKRINSPTMFYEAHCQDMRFLQQEEMRVASFNTKMHLLDLHILYKGSVHTTVIRIAEILHKPVLLNATGMIVAHNHPSGDTTPSPEDSAVTREILKTAKSMDIDFLDHLVIGANGFVSMKERGLGF